MLLCKILRLFCVKTMRRWQFLVQLGENTTLVGSDSSWVSTNLIYAALNLKLQHTVANETDLPSTRSVGVVGTATQVWLKSHQPHAQQPRGRDFLACVEQLPLDSGRSPLN